MTSRPSAPESLSTEPFAPQAAGAPALPAAPASAAEPQPAEWPHRDIDPRTGRLRPISAEIDAQDDTPEEVYDQFMRNVDDERRRQGRPTAFQGYY